MRKRESETGKVNSGPAAINSPYRSTSRGLTSLPQQLPNDHHATRRRRFDNRKSRATKHNGGGDLRDGEGQQDDVNNEHDRSADDRIKERQDEHLESFEHYPWDRSFGDVLGSSE